MPVSRAAPAISRPARSAVGIVVLAVAQCPQEGREGEQAQKKRDRYENQQAVHQRALCKRGVPALSRSALPITSSEDDDIATAATSGVTSPEMASGTATRL